MTQALLRLSCLLTKTTERVATSVVGQISESDASALFIAYPCAIPSICLLNPTIRFHIVMRVCFDNALGLSFSFKYILYLCTLHLILYSNGNYC